ncbi:hypothetical protein, partial [Amycolatopsis sp. NPDC059657]|uniref:hypothetical protein n=1 Tax=Amycolatopsis sp. NPDC059657 TaxID=3346899 RepID=UPI00366CB479
DTTNTEPANATTSDGTNNQHPITNYSWSTNRPYHSRPPGERLPVRDRGALFLAYDLVTAGVSRLVTIRRDVT